MGEIFTVERPAAVLQFTGERMTSSADGQIEYEHLHRYCFARLFCRGKDVVDVAAGEGYGSALLAQVANRVIGVEMAADAVGHAISAYRHPNLSFIRGDARQLPLQSNIADVVVSFETIEHLYEQQLFLAEIRRILRPGGVLVISSPDSEVFSYPGSPVNPFHLRELTRDEFKEALCAIFPNTQFYSQRALIGSAITIDGPSNGVITFDRRSEDYVDAVSGLPRAPYLVAVASARSLDEPCQTLYIDQVRTAYLLTSRYGDAEHLSLPELEAALALANSRAEASAASESAALAEFDRLRMLIAELTQQREAAKLAAAQAVHGEIAGFREKLAQAEQKADELGEALAAAQSQVREREKELEVGARETAELCEALAEAERKAPELERVVTELKAAFARNEGGATRRLTRHLTRRRRRRGIAALIRAGDRARDAGNWALAAPHYRNALERDPDLAPIWVQFGHALKEQGDYAEAETAYRRALALDRSSADTHLQLGNLLRLRTRRMHAIDAYATAVRLDPELVAAREALQALVGYPPSQSERAITLDAGQEPTSAESGLPNGATATLAANGLALADRYGALLADASRKAGTGHDLIWLGVIDWHFRIQRPQHLAANLAETGARIFYISVGFEPADEKGRFRIIDSPHLGVFEIRLRLWSDASESIYQGLSEAAVGELQRALDE